MPPGRWLAVDREADRLVRRVPRTKTEYPAQIPIGGSASVHADFSRTQGDAVDRGSRRPSLDRSGVSDLLEVRVAEEVLAEVAACCG